MPEETINQLVDKGLFELEAGYNSLFRTAEELLYCPFIEWEEEAELLRIKEIAIRGHNACQEERKEK